MRMSKYERARLLGTRAEQISHGAPVLVVVPRGVTNPLDIAEIELSEKKLPLIVRRYLPSGEYEDCDANALLPPCPETWSPLGGGVPKEEAVRTARGKAGDSSGRVSKLRGSRRGVKRRFRDAISR